MCYFAAAMVPIITTALSTAAAVAGGAMASRAQAQTAAAIRDQNAATQAAQNTAFNQRIAASREQSEAQFGTAQEEIAARTAAADTMRQGQNAALQRTQDILDAENTTAERLRAVGDQRAQELIAQTTGPVLDTSQQDAQARAEALLAGFQANTPTGPEATDPSGSGTSDSSRDPATKKAIARRMGIAAANIRQYGADIARVAAYGQPLLDIGQAVRANATGIMPAQEAERLLRAGAGTRLLPAQIAYGQATQFGQAEDTAAQARAQEENTYAGLKYASDTGLANLSQSDADTLAANIANQKKADAKYQAQLGSLTTSLGQLGLYAAGRYGPATISNIG